MQIHEVHPVKFGGSPTDISNKIPLTPKEHAQYTTWWNRLLKELKK
ncbi:HNH endonuclease signature motif containing protein [Clostridium kluyveri]|nr:HNH endonuclease signature motif containing protein [Clostridium kluyveri]UZQ52274.1 HNH endonuclease [Clostridium kluyveri]